MSQKQSHHSESMDLGSMGAELDLLGFFKFLDSFLLFFDFFGGAMGERKREMQAKPTILSPNAEMIGDCWE